MSSKRTPSDTLLVDSSSPVGTMAKPVDPARQPLVKFTPAPLAAPRTPPPGMTPCPSPGVYPGVDFDTYVGWDALNHSTLKRMADTPMHFKHALDNPVDKKTSSKRLGTAMHALLLEPGTMRGKVIPAPINEKTGKAYGDETKAWAEYAEQHPGKMILSGEEIERLAAMARALSDHPTAKTICAAPGLCEVCIVWDDPTTGLRCKARIDKVLTEFGWTDFKTCESAKWSEMSRAIVDYSYVTQFPFYKRGVDVLRKMGKHNWGPNMVFTAVETAAPHGVCVYTLTEETFNAGDAIVGEWLSKVKQCRETNVFPGYPDVVQPIDAPDWWMKRFSNALE